MCGFLFTEGFVLCLDVVVCIFKVTVPLLL